MNRKEIDEMMRRDKIEEPEVWVSETLGALALAVIWLMILFI